MKRNFVMPKGYDTKMVTHMKIIVILVLVCILSGCASMSYYKRPQAEAGIDQRGTWVRCENGEPGCPPDGKKYISDDN